MPAALIAPVQRQRGVKPPAGTQLNRGHPLAQGMKFCFPLNENGGRPLDLVAGRNLTSLPTWTSSRWGPAIDVNITGSGTAAYGIQNPLGILPAAAPFAVFALLDFGDASVGTSGAVYACVNPPGGSPRFAMNYETFSNANLGVTKSAVVDMACGTAPPSGKSAVLWQFEADRSGTTCVNGAISVNSNTAAFDTAGSGAQYGTVGRDDSKYRIAALYHWHRNLTRTEMLMLNDDPFCMIGERPTRSAAVGSVVHAWHTSVVKVWV